MIRRLLFSMVLLALVLCMGCAEQVTPTVWLLGGTEVENPDLSGADNTYTVRGGILLAEKGEPGTEFGLSTTGWTRDAADQFYGLYAVQHLPPDPNGLLGRMYIGGQASFPGDNDGGAFGPVVGTITKLGGVDVVTQFEYLRFNDALEKVMEGSDDEVRITMGVVFPFPLLE